MQAYSRGFARIYNLKWINFAAQVAPCIQEFYERTRIGQSNRSLLDVCCGTGQLAVYFLERDYRVTGLDLSEHMLRYARENAAHFVESGQAKFVRADAAGFLLDERFGLIVSTYDALNHLPGDQALKGCFQSVFRVLEPDGYFIFDLNTRAGLMRWNGINIEDTEESLIVNRGIYDGQSDQALTRITGFVRNPDGSYERFVETAFNTVFDMDTVRRSLLDIGWRDVYFARAQDLSEPIAEPEAEGRVFIVARK
jgi:SAM-dependent methyltransferase